MRACRKGEQNYSTGISEPLKPERSAKLSWCSSLITVGRRRLQAGVSAQVAALVMCKFCVGFV